MRGFPLIIAASLGLAACAVPATTVVPTGPVNMQQVTWKEATPVFARLADARDCGAQALGVSIGATPDEIYAAQTAIPQAEVDQRRDACMVARGYTITQKPVCQPGQADGRQIYIGSVTDALPPLATVECLVPGDGRPGTAGFIMAG
jgi:hypothetical protein